MVNRVFSFSIQLMPLEPQLYKPYRSIIMMALSLSLSFRLSARGWHLRERWFLNNSSIGSDYHYFVRMYYFLKRFSSKEKFCGRVSVITYIEECLLHHHKPKEFKVKPQFFKMINCPWIQGASKVIVKFYTQQLLSLNLTFLLKEKEGIMRLTN